MACDIELAGAPGALQRRFCVAGPLVPERDANALGKWKTARQPPWMPPLVPVDGLEHLVGIVDPLAESDVVDGRRGERLQ